MTNSVSHLKEGLKIAQAAVDKDEAGNKNLAISYYQLAIVEFEKAINLSRDHGLIQLIQEKCIEYNERIDSISSVALTTELFEQSLRTHAHTINSPVCNSPSRSPASYSPVLTRSTPTTITTTDYSSTQYQSAATPQSFIAINYASSPNMDNQNPLVLEKINDASLAISFARTEEDKGNLQFAVVNFNKGLNSLLQAYQMENNLQVKELVRLKYNVLVTRVEELVETIPPKDLKLNAAVTKHIQLIDSYSARARKLVDGASLSEALEYYKLVTSELKVAMESEEFIATKQWLAKRALVTERRIGGISTLINCVKMALPYPWSKLFGVVTFGLNKTGITDKAQLAIDNKLSKMAGMDTPPPPIDKKKSKSNLKKSKSKK